MNDDPTLQRYRQATAADPAAVDRIARRVADASRPRSRAPVLFAGAVALGALGLLGVLLGEAAAPEAAPARPPEVQQVGLAAPSPGAPDLPAARTEVAPGGAELPPEPPAALHAPRPPDATQPAPEPLAPEGAPPAPQPRALSAPDRPQAFDGGDGVALTLHGAARQQGQVYTLERGRLDLEVPADRGLAVSVLTREARVEVVGTGFGVARSALGTDVEVRHGAVRVTCAGAAPTLLQRGQSAQCLPTSAAGMLARVRALRGVPTDALLAELDAGLALARSGDPVAIELRLLRAELLFNADRTAEARAEVDRLRAAGPGARADEVYRLEAALERRAGRCPAALEALDKLTAPTPADAALRASCAVP